MQTTNTWRQIGSDVRWFLGGENSLLELLSQYLVPEEVEVCFNNALAATTAARQLAIRQCLRDGVYQAFAPSGGKQRQRSEIRRAIEEVAGVSDGQANRILNGLGLFSMEHKKGTIELARRYVQGSRQIAREIDVELLLMLSVGASERLEQFMLRPYQFVANTASTILRLRIETNNTTDSQLDVTLNQRTQFPLIKADVACLSNPDLSSPLHTLTPLARMALYGLYLWQTGGLHFVEDVSDVSSDEARRLTAVRTIRLAQTEAAWVFPEFLGQPGQVSKAWEDERYIQLVLRAVDEVALVVGQAVCGANPYSAAVEAGE